MVTGCELVIERGPQAGATYRLPIPSSCVVGRSSDCDIAVIGTPDPLSASRKQCRLDVTPAGVRVQDLGSRNGTFLNGELIGQRFCAELPSHDWWTSEGHAVRDGDEISFSGVTIRVHVMAADLDWMPADLAGAGTAPVSFPYRELID